MIVSCIMFHLNTNAAQTLVVRPLLMLTHNVAINVVETLVQLSLFLSQLLNCKNCLMKCLNKEVVTGHPLTVAERY